MINSKRKETWKPNLDLLEGIITRKYEKSYDNRPSSTKNWIRCFRSTHYFEYSLVLCLSVTSFCRIGNSKASFKILS